jgi:hypothetical protein
MLYSYSGMAPIRHDLFLIFRFWHAYQYSHIAVWNAFRATVLADAFFTLFPTQKLLSKPRLVQNATFFTWLRLCYPAFRENLSRALKLSAAKLIESDLRFCKELSNSTRQLSKIRKNNLNRAAYIHLFNLQTLFEFVIPTVQDYGSTLKLNDWEQFLTCFQNLFALFAMCKSKGSTDYQRSMYAFLSLVSYWKEHNLPVIRLFQLNHTLFSEEAGEVALSVLVNAQPPNAYGNPEHTRQLWQVVKMRYTALRDLDTRVHAEKKHRVIRKFLIHSLFRSCVYYLGNCQSMLTSVWLHFLFDNFP